MKPPAPATRSASAGHEQRAAGGAAHVAAEVRGADVAHDDPAVLEQAHAVAVQAAGAAGWQPVAIDAADTRVTDGNTALCSAHHRLARAAMSCSTGVVSAPHPVAAQTSRNTRIPPAETLSWPKFLHAMAPPLRRQSCAPAPCAARADGSRLPPTTQEETMQFGYFAMPSHPPGDGRSRTATNGTCR